MAYLLCRWLISSRLGRLLLAMRDDENPVRFSGYDPTVLKKLVFSLSGGISGVAGALSTPQVCIISLSMKGIVPSIEIPIWVAVGGLDVLLGAILGAIVVNGAKSGLSELFPAIWQYFLGLLFIGVLLLFTTGVMGLLHGEVWQCPLAVRRAGPRRVDFPQTWSTQTRSKQPWSKIMTGDRHIATGRNAGTNGSKPAPGVVRAYLGNSQSQRPQSGRLGSRDAADLAVALAAD